MLHLYGAEYSVYVRAVRIALAEKGVSYHQTPIDIFNKAGVPDSYLDLQPFGKIPALRHAGFELFETTAILQYIDEAFEGPDLQPSSPQARARMAQILSILNSYAYRTLVWDIFVERIAKPQEGKQTDEAKIAAALPAAKTVLNALEKLADDDGPFLLGSQITLADCLAAPMFDLFLKTPEALALVEPAPRLGTWWRDVSARTSFLETLPQTRQV
ncbi:glutathione S-transferase family protein [Labrenzia sp. PHM005]|nr:glutathione S-transferase family protein [Labrenzia sp. PHM005]